MNALSNAVNPSIGSRDIAEWVESRHDNMKRAIERLAEKGIIQLPPMEEVKNTSGQVWLTQKLRDAGVLKTREKAA